MISVKLSTTLPEMMTLMLMLASRRKSYSAKYHLGIVFMISI